VASASLTGLPANHIDFDLPIANILHTSCPHYYRFGQNGESEEDFATRMAQELEEQILREGPDTVAAFIAEPVMGAGGAILPPNTYFQKIQAVLDKYDILFIADEVITGFGRLGTPFGSQRLGIRPDTLSFAKAVTSAYLPLGGVMIPEAMYQAMLDESRKVGTFGHGFTYSGHPVSSAVALKVLEIYERERIFEGVKAKAPVFEGRLAALADHPLVGEARGLGLIGGLELVANKRTKAQYDPKKAVAAKCVGFAQAEGLIVRSLLGDRISLCPPLIISEAEIHELFDRLTRALDRTADWIAKEGLMAA
jgi:4-aminobutyrate--pyruvate transaminase